jgi:hypothetical protein
VNRQAKFVRRFWPFVSSPVFLGKSLIPYTILGPFA